jgi:penicillin-binding protein 2
VPGSNSQDTEPFSTASSGGHHSSQGGRQVAQSRNNGGIGSGSSGWSPNGDRERLWPKILLVTAIVGVLITGSILIATQFGGDVSDEDGPAVVVDASPTPTNTVEPDDEDPTPTVDDGNDADATATPNLPPPATDETPTPAPQPTATPPDPDRLEKARGVAETYVEMWSSRSYDQMYALISADAKSRMTEEEFVNRYEAIAIEAGIVEVDATVDDGNDDDIVYPIRVTIESSRIGEFKDELLLTIVQENGEFRVDWSPDLIFADLGDGFVRWTSDVPQRGRILDRKGRPLAHSGFISRVGVIPGQVSNESQLLKDLSDLLDMPEDQIKRRYEGGEPTWFMPVKDLPDNVGDEFINRIADIEGAVLQKWPARVYPAGEAAAHVVGYLSEITAEELPELARRGYEPGDRIGRSGVESYAEQWLAGQRGGQLKLINSDGSTIRILGEVEAEPAMDVVLTIDLDVQRSAFEALGEDDVKGSAVILDPNNGQILAMASNPTYDPNNFILGISDEEWQRLSDPQRQPLINRATIVGYPTGSVFKLVTAAAGMVHFNYDADTWLSCPGSFSLPGSSQTWADWVPGGQGEMNLHLAIVRSCNTVFYKMGAELDMENENWLPEMTRAFGFGERTGIVELYDVPGVVPDPQWKSEVIGDFWARGDAVNLAIGQGYFLATPLQLAKAYAAVTNGGTLWKPYLVMDVVKLDGTIVHSTEPEETGRLPLSAEQIQVFQNAMEDVVHASNGTATQAFTGVDYRVSGKTGTAETGRDGEEAHGWFGGFTPSDSPRITIVTMVENGVTGSGSAAPIARNIIDGYYELYPR